MSSLRRRLNLRLGLALPGVERSIWILGETPASFEAAGAFIQSLAEAFPQYRLVMMSSDTRTCDWLEDRFVDDEVLPAPGHSWAGRRYVRRLRPSLLLRLDPDGPNKTPVLDRSVLHSIPVIEVLPGDTARDSAAVFPRLVKAAPFDPPVSQSWRIPTWRDRAGQSRLWKACAPYFSRRRIDDWESLGRRLGHPGSILCLGNGPSSEDPRLARIDYDCLMRVNWRWKLRGFLADPDVVFVGDAATLHRLSPRVFGLWNIAQEYALLLRHFVTHGPRRMEYFTMERISAVIRDHDWPARPSNGAMMVAAAAALKPERLTIAGIDLFRHPEGRYPGDPRSLNAYSRVHTGTVDTAIIDLALRDYKGELIIIGNALRRALGQVRNRHASPRK